MKKIKLLNKYSKLFGLNKYFVIIQYLLVFTMLFNSIPELRNSYEAFQESKAYPFNKVLYYENLRSLRPRGDLILNADRLRVNNEKFMDLVAKEKDISSISPLINSVSIMDRKTKYKCNIYDINSFNSMAGKDFSKKDNNGSLKVLVSRPRFGSAYKVGNTYPASLLIDGEEKEIDMEVVGYFNPLKDKIIKPTMYFGRTILLEAFHPYVRENISNYSFYALENDFTSSLDSENPYNSTGFNRVVYFKEDASQENIDAFVEKVRANNIGYIFSNTEIQKAQKDRLIEIIFDHFDKLLALSLLLILTLFVILKTSYGKIRHFNAIVSILGLDTFNIYLLNFLYNVKLYFIASLIYIIPLALTRDGYLSWLKDASSPPDYNRLLKGNEYLTITFIFLIVNTLLFVYMYLMDKKHKEGSLI